jgi:hypothetical protein
MFSENRRVACVMFLPRTRVGCVMFLTAAAGTRVPKSPESLEYSKENRGEFGSPKVIVYKVLRSKGHRSRTWQVVDAVQQV